MALYFYRTHDTSGMDFLENIQIAVWFQIDELLLYGGIFFFHCCRDDDNPISILREVVKVALSRHAKYLIECDGFSILPLFYQSLSCLRWLQPWAPHQGSQRGLGRRLSSRRGQGQFLLFL